jgi:23S rRNA pseudouridine1911/1915/1917 synthase
VHRIDKETSGLVVFTRTWLAKQSLSQQFRFHTVRRVYLAIVHGAMSSQTIRSHLLQDRGDGLRGSIEALRGKKKPPLSQGQLAVTHVEVRERLAGATLIACRLETGRTHQIRIHLSEAGHPLVGERVYIRDFEKRGGEPIRAPRLMLHAAELGFDHPKTEREVRFESPLPKDVEETLSRLRRSG